MSVQATYPIRIEGRLEHPSRWLWLVKWLLAIPHYVVLAVLWAAFVVLSVFAFFAILFTGRYPRAIFEFNTGLLRWSWRVGYYAYSALGTDRYPPFTLDEVADYPAHLTIDYPERLSRGLVLVKFWLLAIPHYLIVAILVSGAWTLDRDDPWLIGGGLIGVLVLIAAIILMFTGRYPQGLFDLILGLDRWVLRVVAYAASMTDAYPPFRLDTGEREPGDTLTVPAAPTPSGAPAPADAPTLRRGRSGWTGGRIASVVIGSILILVSLGPLGGGAVALFFDRTQRDAAGFVTVGPDRLTTITYALTSEDADFIIDEPAWRAMRAVLGTVRVRITPVDGTDRVFVGIADAVDVRRYLGGVARATPVELDGANRYRTIDGGAPSAAPADAIIWAASSTGAGARSFEWEVQAGSWTVVMMNADGSRGVDVRADFGARAPALSWIAAALIVVGILMLAAGISLVAVPVRRATPSG